MKFTWRVVIPVLLLLLIIAIGIGFWRAPDWIRSVLITELEQVGVEVQQLDEPCLSWRGITFGQARLRWQQAATQVDVEIENLVTNIDWSAQRVEALSIGHLRLHYQSSGSGMTSDWPALQLPALPIDQINIDMLTAELQLAEQTLSLQGALQLTPKPQHWQLLWQQAAYTLNVELKQQQAWQLNAELSTDKHQASLALSLEQNSLANATLQWQVQAPLAMLSLLPLPEHSPSIGGELKANGTLLLGAQSGDWQQLLADLTVSSFTAEQQPIAVNGKIKAALSLIQESATLTLQQETALHVAALPQWQLSATDITLPTPLQIHLALNESAVSSLQLQGAVQASVQYQDVTTTWQLNAGHEGLNIDLQNPSLPVQVSANAERWSFAEANFKQLAANGQLRLQKQDEQWQIKTASPATLNWQQIGYQDFLVQSGEAALNASSLLDKDFSLRKLNAELSDSDWRIKQGDTEYTLQQGKIHYQQETNGLQLELHANQAAMQTPEQTISVQDAQVRAKGKDLAALKKQIQISAKQLEHPLLQEWPKPNLQMVASEKRAGVWLAEGQLLLAQKQLAEFSGQHQLAEAKGQGQVRWQWPVAELQQMLTRKPKALSPLSLVAGSSQGELALQWQKVDEQWQLHSSGQTHVDDTALVWQESSASGLFVDADIKDMLALHGHVKARMSAFALAAGINATELSAEIDHSPERLILNNISWQLLDAKWYVPDQQFSKQDTIQAPVALLGLNLEKLLKLFDVHGLSGQGTLDGAIPITLGDDGVVVRDAELHARIPGVLRYAPGEPDPNANIGLQVLRDFHYQTLRVRFDYQESGEYLVKLTLNGSNPSFYNGYPINLTMNIQGKLPGLFKAAVFSGDFNKHILESIGAGTGKLPTQQ